MNVVHVFIKIVDSRKNNSVVYEFYQKIQKYKDINFTQKRK